MLIYRIGFATFSYQEIYQTMNDNVNDNDVLVKLCFIHACIIHDPFVIQQGKWFLNINSVHFE